MASTSNARIVSAPEFDRLHGGELCTVHVWLGPRLAQIIGGLWLPEAIERAGRYSDGEYRATITAHNGDIRGAGSSSVADDRPCLCDYRTGETIRPATSDEETASIIAAQADGGVGAIEVDGRSCYVER